MKCLVTGGAGFIGSHLAERLLGDGHTVRVLDDFSAGRRDNLARPGDARRLEVIEADIASGDDLAPLFAGIDHVFHLAGRADIVPSIQDPSAYHRVNVNGTVAVLEAARRAGVSRFVYAASSSCYGIPDAYPTPETAPIRPQYPYALTKWIGEEYVRHWGATYGLPVVSLRLFNVYGPRSRTSGAYGAVFGVFLAQKLAGKQFTVVGDGEQCRDFTYVADVADAFVRAAATEAATGAVLNIGTGTCQTVNRLVALLGGDVVRLPKRPGEPDRTQADATEAGRLLDWRPGMGFEEGVAIMLANIAHWRGAVVWTPETVAEATRDWFRYLDQPATGG